MLAIRTVTVQLAGSLGLRATTVHMKDWASGRDGVAPFLRGVLQGLR